MIEDLNNQTNRVSPPKGSRNDRLIRQGLALALYLFCPLGAFFAWQAGLFFLSGLFTALVGLAFILTIQSG